QQLLIETLLVRFALLDRAVELEDVLRSLGRDSGLGTRDSGPGGGASVPSGSRKSVESVGPSRGSEQPELRRSSPTPQSRNPNPETRIPTPESRTSTRADGSALRIETPNAAPREPLDLNRLTEKWDALVERMRGNGKPMLATALAHASPV